MNLKTEINNLHARIIAIEQRNKRVEADKAWEISKTRTIFIAISTYILIVFFMLLIKDNHPFLNAFVATAGYFISTGTYDILKKWWLKRRENYKT
ncbi:hypothetical protein HY612_02185 [Candidatus Roizmanbacteria bacterium]|nr:hypothetical protein [Candidatus Roizmanbacteria bacterium]